MLLSDDVMKELIRVGIPTAAIVFSTWINRRQVNKVRDEVTNTVNERHDETNRRIDTLAASVRGQLPIDDRPITARDTRYPHGR